MKIAKYLLLIILASLLIRILYVTIFLEHDKYYFEDTNLYYTAAASLAEDGTFGQDAEKPNRPFMLEPVYSIILAGIMLVFGKGYLVLRLSQALILCASGILFYRILKKWATQPFVLIGTFLYLFYPFYMGFSGLLLPEAIYLPLLVLFLFFGLEYVDSGKNGYFYAAAIVLAILFHTKVTSISLIALLVALPLIREKRVSLSWFQKSFLTVTIVLMLSVPWGIRNYSIWGKVTIPRTRGSSAEKSDLSKRTSSLLEAGQLEVMLTNTYNYFSPLLTKFNSKNRFNKKIYQVMSFLFVLPLLLSTLILPFFRRNRFILILYGFLIFYSLPYIIFFGQTRYRLPIDFVMIIFLVLLIEFVYLKTKSQKFTSSV